MKVVFVGDSQVGKTSIINCLISGSFDQAPASTIGASFHKFRVETSHGYVNLNIWDTAGQEKYRSLAPMYYRTANAIVLVFDLTSRESFEALNEWVESIEGKILPDATTFLVGNKLDLPDRQVPFSEAEQFSFKSNCSKYIETSAKSNQSVTDLFKQIAEFSNNPGQTEESVVLSPPEAQTSSSNCC